MGLAVSAVGDQDVIEVAGRVRDYLDKKRPTLPEGVYLDEWADSTYYLNGRLTMMLKNLLLGTLLVLIILSIFMDLKIAFWVMIGLPVCFLGTFALMPMEPFDVSLNLISLFGFILVLGIMVDDAIIIGESVYTATENGRHSLDRVIKGAKRVAVPATFGVLTTICAFMPTIFVEGALRNFPAACGYVVLFSLVFSLIESKLILPSHLAHMNTGLFRWIKLDWQDRMQLRVNEKLLEFVETRYRPFVEKAIRNRYTTFAYFLAALILTIGLVGGGWVRYVMQPDVPNDYIQANLQMARGTADAQTRKAVNDLLQAVYKVNEEYKAQSGDDEGFIKHIFNYGTDGIIGFFMIELTKAQQRQISSSEIVQQWREVVGEIPGAKELTISDAEPHAGPDLSFVLVSSDEQQLEEAANALADRMASYAGVFDIKNGIGEVVDEIHLKIKPSAEALGLSMFDLGRQVREAFYGAEAQRVQRDNEEVKVMVRYPLADRRSEADLEGMYIRTAAGIEVPITSVAELTVLPGYAKSIRINGEPAVPVSASVDKRVVEPSKLVEEITEQWFPELQKKLPDVQLRLDGSTLDDTKIENEFI